MDEKSFLKACERVEGKDYPRQSVGLLSEKTLHAVLKEYFEEDHSCHEVKIGTYFADVFHHGEIVEIQTRSFDRLKEKLSVFLPLYPVTVVYPIPYEKNLIWLDRESGEASAPRRVPKRGSFYDAGRELLRVFDYLSHPNLTVLLLLVNMDEYRFLSKNKGKKRGSEKIDRIPSTLVGELSLHGASSFKALLPEALPSPFTAKDFKKAIKGGPRNAPALLTVLYRLGIVERVGKEGNAYLYEKV